MYGKYFKNNDDYETNKNIFKLRSSGKLNTKSIKIKVFSFIQETISKNYKILTFLEIK